MVGQFFFLSSAINEGINPHGVGNNGIFGDHDERTIIGWKVSLVVVSLKDSVKIRLKGLFTDEIHHVH
jgi:4-hydroxy-L-threonine phosphate dehydrogenase PdxA